MSIEQFQALLAQHSFACGLIIKCIKEDYENGLITEEELYDLMKYWKGRADSYRTLSEEIAKGALALLDNANTFRS